ncbi:amp dependent CoA ligase [Clohesyomyces aquaticus]|uniref:Amp dependent CoA ligase n=1 Tax=Clohesyomyces aquaticus TaxID=1231657 RepID=A0A1Y1ZFF3_9PLEO|nr:amp dependent CoA ligase [Clohesyomyces aquaticus]
MDINFAAWVLSPIAYDEGQPLLIDAANPGRSLSFKQLRNQVRRLIAGLRAAGIRPGDCVLVNSFNDISYTILYLGIIGSGAIFSGVNPAYSAHELAHHMEMVAAKLIIVEPAMLDKTVAAAESTHLPKPDIYAFDVHGLSQRADIVSWSVLLENGHGDFQQYPRPDATVAAYQTSSGTSGLPKAAMIPHSYLISQARLRMSEPCINYDVRRLTALPPMHAFATPIIPSSIREGSLTYIMRRYDDAEFVSCVEKYRITETWLPPPPIIQLPKSHLTSTDALRYLRRIWFGGASLAYENQLPLQHLLHGDARIHPVWGMTEVGWITTIPPSWPGNHGNDMVGMPLPDFRVRAVDDEGRKIRDVNVDGELQILAPHPMLGYLNNPNANEEIFTVDSEGRWINSGDIGHISSEGHIFILDRKKDIIKVRGWQVSPSEVESRIHQQPEVVDVCVVGIALSTGEGERVRAFVVRRDDSHLTADEVKQFAAISLAKYKVPEEVVFVLSIPRNPTGKILRRVLREQVMEEGGLRNPVSNVVGKSFCTDPYEEVTQPAGRQRYPYSGLHQITPRT